MKIILGLLCVAFVYGSDMNVTKPVSIETNISIEPQTKHSFEQLLQDAKQKDKIIIIKATAPHCHYCLKMDQEVLHDQEVISVLQKDFLLFDVDVSRETIPLDLQVSMTPTFFFVFPPNHEGKVKTKRIPGAWTKEDFLQILKESLIAKKKQQ